MKKKHPLFNLYKRLGECALLPSEEAQSVNTSTKACCQPINDT